MQHVARIRWADVVERLTSHAPRLRRSCRRRFPSAAVSRGVAPRCVLARLASHRVVVSEKKTAVVTHAPPFARATTHTRLCAITPLGHCVLLRGAPRTRSLTLATVRDSNADRPTAVRETTRNDAQNNETRERSRAELRTAGLNLQVERDIPPDALEREQALKRGITAYERRRRLLLPLSLVLSSSPETRTPLTALCWHFCQSK